MLRGSYRWGHELTIEVRQWRSELLTWASDSTALYGLDLSRMSIVLLAQLWTLETTRIICPLEVTEAIKVLEDLTTADLTTPPELFRHAPLQGFAKKHFTSSRFIVRNLLIFAQSKRGARFLEKAFADGPARGAGDDRAAEVGVVASDIGLDVRST